MPKAEVGSTKHLNNKLKSKGLQRLRWYCQVCERQMRDHNGFKMHTESQSHVRQMLIVGEDPQKYINDYSNQFQRDFLQLLRTGHGEKKVHLNHFYQEYISNKEHVHMNSTKWPSLMEFAKFLGREGICRVEEEDDKGIHVAWIDNSPENLRRQDAVRKKERQDRGDEEREQMAIRDQVRRAKRDAEARGEGEDDDEMRDLLTAGGDLKRDEGEKIKLSFGAKPAANIEAPRLTTRDAESLESGSFSVAPTEPLKGGEQNDESPEKGISGLKETHTVGPSKVPLKMGFSQKPKNVFAAAKKNALGSKKGAAVEQPKKMSEAERIMREEMDRKKRGPSGFGGPTQKKPRF